MGFSQEAGYQPASIQTLMGIVRQNINDQFNLNYTPESFIGSNFYKNFYALIQELQKSEVKTSEILLKIQDYFKTTNERISRPVGTIPGIIEKLQSLGYIASVKKMTLEDAGTANVCVDVDDGDHATGVINITSYANLISGTPDTIKVGTVTFTAQAGAATPGTATFQAATSNTATAESLATQINEHNDLIAEVFARAEAGTVYLRAIHGGEASNDIELEYTDNDSNVGASLSGSSLEGGTDEDSYPEKRLEICTTLSKSLALGLVVFGTEEESITESNGQTFDWRYWLPNKMPALLRLTISLSDNNQFVIKSPEEVKDILLENIASKYRLGWNFEPQRYFTIVDAPWADSVLLEWSIDNGANYSNAVYEASYQDLFVINLENITVIEV